MPLPTSIPFLEAAYAPRPRQPDTGGESFMRAFERSQDRRDAEPERLLRMKNMEQTNQLNALRLTDAIRSRDDAIAAEGSLTVFADRIRRAQLLGPSEAAGQRSVVEWVESHRGILTLPAGKAMWNDYLNSVEDDRRHKAQIDEIKTRGDVSLQTQAAMGVRQEGVESQRQTGRMELAEFRSAETEERDRLKATLGVSHEKGVSRQQFVTRELKTVLDRHTRMTEGEGIDLLGKLYDEKLSPTGVTAPVAAPVTTAGRVRLAGPDGRTFNLPASQIDAFLASPQGQGFRRLE